MKDYEGLPNVFIQSWLHGVPVVSLHSDPDDFIKKYKIGYQTGDFNLLVEKVRELINVPDLRIKMGQRARDFAIKEFSIQTIVDRFIEIISIDKTGK
jgi:glycosyltransferase involved in cell wall biosynthesis